VRAHSFGVIARCFARSPKAEGMGGPSGTALGFGPDVEPVGFIHDAVEVPMGHPKLSAAENVLTPDFPRSPQQTGPSTSAEDLAVVRIAERFAPGVQPPLSSNEQKSAQFASRPVSTLGSRGLIVLLTAFASLPSLVLGTMVWLEVIKVQLPAPMTFGSGVGPSIQSASVAAPLLAKHSGSTEIAFAAPAIVEARAGEDTPLTLALSRTAALPTRSVIALDGLPHGSTLSSGRPYGDGGWNLRPDQIGGLRLSLPETATGQAKLRIRLVTSGGEDIARAETLLRVTHAPRPLAKTHGDERAINEGVQSFVGDLKYNTAPIELMADSVAAPPGDRAAAEAARVQGVSQSQESVPSSLAAKPDPETLDGKNQSVKTGSSAQTSDDDAESWILLSDFVNLREGPSSSTRVIDVLDRGSKLRVTGRKRAWLKVADSTNAQTGWIYSRYARSATTSRGAMQNPAPARLSSSTAKQETDGSLWTRLGRWLVGP